MCKCSYCRKVQIKKFWIEFLSKIFTPKNDGICPACLENQLKILEDL